jgi:hypothetical protein
MPHDKDACTEIIGLLMAFTVPCEFLSVFSLQSQTGLVVYVTYSNLSGSTLRPTQPLIQRVQGSFSPGLKRSERETGHRGQEYVDIIHISA